MIFFQPVVNGRDQEYGENHSEQENFLSFTGGIAKVEQALVFLLRCNDQNNRDDQYISYPFGSFGAWENQRAGDEVQAQEKNPVQKHQVDNCILVWSEHVDSECEIYCGYFN